MEDKTLIIMSATITLVGLLILLITKPSLDPNTVTVKGNVHDVKNNNNQWTAKVTTEILAVSYQKPIIQGNQTIYGRLNQYQNKPELIIS